MPVAPTMSDNSDKIIAVNVYADTPKPFIEIPKEVASKQKRLEETKDMIKESAKKMIVDDEHYSMFDILDLSFDAMQKTLIRYRLAGYPSDFVIEIPQSVCGTYDFHKAYEVIEVGKKAAREFLRKLL